MRVEPLDGDRDGVYDGIDVRYYGTQRQLEYDFIVAAGADIVDVRARTTSLEQIYFEVMGVQPERDAAAR